LSKNTLGDELRSGTKVCNVSLVSNTRTSNKENEMLNITSNGKTVGQVAISAAPLLFAPVMAFSVGLAVLTGIAGFVSLFLAVFSIVGTEWVAAFGLTAIVAAAVAVYSAKSLAAFAMKTAALAQVHLNK
jgi:hypothetical protein